MDHYLHDQLGGRIWTEDEDRRLIAIIQSKEPRYPRWNEVACEHGEGRSSKSCRLRWENQLKPDINHGPFEPEEDAIVTEMQASVGNKWAKIARALSRRKEAAYKDAGIFPRAQPAPFRRTDNHVKNRWHAVLKKGKGCKRRVPADPGCKCTAGDQGRAKRSHRQPRQPPQAEHTGAQQSSNLDPAATGPSHTSIFPLYDGIFSEDKLLPDHAKQPYLASTLDNLNYALTPNHAQDLPCSLDDLDFEFPPTPGVSGPGILGVPGSRSTSDTFSNIFVGNMCCDPFACSDRSRDVDQLDASVESQLSFVQRFLEPVL